MDLAATAERDVVADQVYSDWDVARDQGTLSNADLDRPVIASSFIAADHNRMLISAHS